MKSSKFIISLLFCLFVPCAVFGGGGSESSSSQKNSSSSANSTSSQKSASSSASASSSSAVKYWDGDGGKGKSIAILAPSGNGLAKEQDYIPSLVQGEFVSNFSGFSAISVLDRQSLDAQYAELLSGYYDDNAQASKDLGKLSPTDYIMGGKITKTATGYAMQISITKSADKMTAASYSGTITFAELDNLSGVRLVSMDLLQKMGVALKDSAKKELSGAGSEASVKAQTALARGITAQKQGTEIAALSYYFQAAAFQPALVEAENRASVLAANISSGNIGADIRNEIEWRKQWIARLQEAETFFANYVKTPPQYILTYSTDIKKGDINWQNETVALSFNMECEPDEAVWIAPVNEVILAVKSGLDSTGKTETWELKYWPAKSATGGKTPFVSMNNNFTVVAEIINDKGKTIGSQTVYVPYGYNVDSYIITQLRSWKGNVSFPGVKADDITDTLSIRITSIDGIPAETAARQKNINILPMEEYHKMLADTVTAKIATGTLKVGDRGPSGGFVFYDKGKVSDGWRYLEAAPYAAEFEAEYGTKRIDFEWTETKVGSGKRNTKIIVERLKSLRRDGDGYAAQLCANLNIGGKTDWFLPSFDELDLMYQNLKKQKWLGRFRNDVYWSSSQRDFWIDVWSKEKEYESAYCQSFFNGKQVYDAKDRKFCVRAVRAF